MKPLSDSKISSLWGVYRAFKSGKNRGMKTGLPALDKYLKGLGGLVNIQGETSSCKSTLALQIVHSNLSTGRPCLIVDKENGEGRIIDRLICQKHEVSTDILDSLTPDTRAVYEKELNDYPMHVHTENIKEISEVSERLKDMWETYQKPFTVLVDSIQALDPVTDDQRVSLETWLYALDRLKLEYVGRACIIVVSEKNRASYGGQGIGGGKGSNVLDYKPETVLDLKYDEDECVFTLKVSKHRDGLKGGVFEYKKHLVSIGDPRSFCFLLREV